jgi:hypothetical protein
MGIGKLHSLRCQTVDIRGNNLTLRAKASQVAVSKIVGKDKNDIGCWPASPLPLLVHAMKQQAKAAGKTKRPLISAYPNFSF